MPCSESPLGAAERETLLGLARESIAEGLRGSRLALRLEAMHERLSAPGASFVTLQIEGRLRGCIGSLEAHRPLALDVVESAWSAAFRDPRFPPLGAAEFAHTSLHISVLGPPQPLEFDSEEELLALLRPGQDGLILREHNRRGTFLPSVWEQLPEPREFLRRLKLKAGLEAGHWSRDVQAWRYGAESFP